MRKPVYAAYSNRSVRVAEWLALPTSDHGVAGSNPAGGEILSEPKRRFTAQSLSCSPFHRLEMTEILLKGRKTLSHPSIIFEQQRHRPDCASASLISAFAVCCLDRTIPLLAISNHSRLQLASEAEQLRLSLRWLETPKTGFLVNGSCRSRHEFPIETKGKFTKTQHI